MSPILRYLKYWSLVLALYQPTQRYGKPNIWRLQRLLGDATKILDYQKRQGDRPSYYYPEGDHLSSLYSFSQIKSTVELIYDPGVQDNLQRWRERVGEAEANRICEESKAAGDMGHKSLENWNQGKAMGPCPINMMGYRQGLENDILPHLQRGEACLSVTDRHGEVHFLSEIFVADFDRQFIGRLDLVTRVIAPPFNGQRFLLELKGSRQRKKLEYMQSHIIQGLAYQKTFNKVAEAYPEHLEPLAGVALAYMYRDGSGELIPIVGQELAEYEEQWEQWLDCFHDLLGGLRAA
jgi:hypothetical protein